MRSSLLALPVVLSLAAFGCAAPSEGDASTESTSDLTAPTTRECVIDTIMVTRGFLKDFRDAVGPSFIKDYGGSNYKHIEIPGVFDAALTTAEFGEWFYTVVGMDIELEKLPADSTERPRLTAILQGHPSSDPVLATGARNYEAAKAVFNAMTRAVETREEHIVPPHTFDQSWIKTTRASSNGRVICTSTTFPDQGTQEPSVACTFAGVESTSVQIYSVEVPGGKCLAERF